MISDPAFHAGQTAIIDEITRREAHLPHTIHVTQTNAGPTLVRIPRPAPPKSKTRNALIAQAQADVTKRTSPIVYAKNRAQPGDLCNACFKPITPGTRMWTGYDQPSRSKTKYHMEHRPTTT